MILGATDIYTVTFKHEVFHRVNPQIIEFEEPHIIEFEEPYINEFETVEETLNCWDYEIRVDLDRVDIFLTIYKEGLKLDISCQDISDLTIQDNSTGEKFGFNHPNDLFWKVE